MNLMHVFRIASLVAFWDCSVCSLLASIAEQDWVEREASGLIRDAPSTRGDQCDLTCTLGL
jgi:hypothetical protein